ncbi:MAG: putative metal-binding motif-containing protein, partial [Acidobacteriota bacterium]|nr:putative metal-binding motif-containing protein [Acidobacteriota bacterium]
DCDTSIPLDEIDNDSDLYVECSGWNDTQGDQAAILGGADCDDTDIVSYPGAAEQCDGNDNNCDASIPGDELDLDSDLYTECSGWNDTQGDQPSILGGADCDDSDSTSFPGATELCDGNDNNCDASVPLDEIDNDSDLYVECMAWNDTQGDQGAILGGADCDDGDSASFPGAAELCDGNDNNCDATIPLDEIDNDSDLYVECSGWNDTQGDQGAILGGGDCDDTDVVSYPGAAELCDGNDNNCDASVPLDEIDNDADLYVECSGWNDTQGDQGAILGGADCDDTDIVSYPGAAELCDGNDNNCDASVPLDEIDNDADLYVECSGWSDTQGDQGAILGGADCDDTDIVSYPGAAELCDGNDNNCDASVPLDEIDNDADLYVECSVWSDTQGDQGTILGGADCDDTDIASYPGAAELCDGNDNNCDTTVPADELDGDSDLYVSCSGWNDSQGDQPAILGGADCNNSDSSSYPGASEVCDGNDNNCDTIVPTDELDSDSDLYVACSTWADSQGDQPAILGGADCNNADGTSFPGATEVCDGNDNDCDTIVPANELDGDLDLFVACAIWSDTQGDQPSILGGADCDPADMISFPGALEICDGNDNSCSGTADDGDADSDTVLVCDDCDDGNFDVNALPSESQNLLFVDPTTMQWSAPAMLGGTSVNYDVLRTDAADDFVTLPVCVESDDGSDTQAVDANVPASGAVFFYLSRPLNACGDGSPGADSDAIERAAATCP